MGVKMNYTTIKQNIENYVSKKYEEADLRTLEISDKFNEDVKTIGNKIKPHVMYGPITKESRGLGDVLTYRFGYRHGLLIAGIVLPQVACTVAPDIPLVMVTCFWHAVPASIVGAYFGGITGMCTDIILRYDRAEKRHQIAERKKKCENNLTNNLVV